MRATIYETTVLGLRLLSTIIGSKDNNLFDSMQIVH